HNQCKVLLADIGDVVDVVRKDHLYRLVEPFGSEPLYALHCFTFRKCHTSHLFSFLSLLAFQNRGTPVPPNTMLHFDNFLARSRRSLRPHFRCRSTTGFPCRCGSMAAVMAILYHSRPTFQMSPYLPLSPKRTLIFVPFSRRTQSRW